MIIIIAFNPVITKQIIKIFQDKKTHIKNNLPWIDLQIQMICYKIVHRVKINHNRQTFSRLL
jgi:hypothetical protein